MFKKGLAILLALTLVIGLTGCGGNGDDNGEDAVDPNGDEVTWKIGIMSSTVTQNEEEFRAAEKMQENMVLTG